MKTTHQAKECIFLWLKKKKEPSAKEEQRGRRVKFEVNGGGVWPDLELPPSLTFILIR